MNHSKNASKHSKNSFATRNQIERSTVMKTKFTVAMHIKVGRVTPCAPQHWKVIMARRGLTRPTIMRRVALLVLLSTLITLYVAQLSTYGQGTAFTYQGRLNDGANPGNGSYDVRFIIYDNGAGGSQQGPILTNSATAISNGLFTVTLDFGTNFPGAARWLEIAVRTNGGGNFST